MHNGLLPSCIVIMYVIPLPQDNFPRDPMPAESHSFALSRESHTHQRVGIIQAKARCSINGKLVLCVTRGGRCELSKGQPMFPKIKFHLRLQANYMALLSPACARHTAGPKYFFSTRSCVLLMAQVCSIPLCSIPTASRANCLWHVNNCVTEIPRSTQSM